MITDAKNKYYTDLLRKKLFDLSVGIKQYQRTFCNIINKKQAKYILLNGVIITNFQNEANLFKNFFAQQCSAQYGI